MNSPIAFSSAAVSVEDVTNSRASSDATALIRPVVALQDHLGDQHDEHVAAEMAREFVASTSSSLTAAELKAIGLFTSHLDHDVERLRRTLRSAWPPIVGSRYRRGLGRAIARL